MPNRFPSGRKRSAGRRHRSEQWTDSPDRPSTCGDGMGQRRKYGSYSRRPGLVVTGSLGPAAAGKRRAGRTVGLRRAGHVRDMRLLPLARRVALFGRRDIDGVMDPAVPVRRYLGRLGIAVIDHPAPLEAERRVDLAALGAIVGVALLVVTDQFAEPPRPQLCAKGLAAPPCKKFQQKQLHEDSAGWRARTVLMPLAGQIVQTGAGIPALFSEAVF